MLVSLLLSETQTATQTGEDAELVARHRAAREERLREFKLQA
jgi:hypothetical protein